MAADTAPGLGSPAFATAVDTVASLQSGEISSRELLALYVERVERHNPSINAIVTLDVERAFDKAQRADDQHAIGESTGPLHGLPITVKDTLETEGIATTAGDPLLAGHIPDRDADAVTGLAAAGAITFGKTNMPLYGGDAQSYNKLFGTTNNPWDLDRSPGGSSGGSAAALAAGLTSLELGTDIGGSVRNPAHYCGVYGHKPTFGLVSARGNIPPPPGSIREVDMAVVGPLARGPGDLALATRAMAQPGLNPLPEPRHNALADFRIAAWLDDETWPTSGVVGNALSRAVSLLRNAGASINETARPEIDIGAAYEIYQRLNYGATAAGLPDAMFEKLRRLAAELDDSDQSHRALYMRFGTQSHRAWLDVDEERVKLRHAWKRFFEDYDVILLPVVQTTAIHHDHSNINSRTIEVDGVAFEYWDQTVWCGLASAAYLPATAVPVGLGRDGLPVGLQVVGPAFGDLTTIDLATWIARELGGFSPPPGF